METRGLCELLMRRATLLWWIVLIVAVLPIAFRQVSISDAWWHIAIGKWLVQERSLPDLSRFYFPPTNSYAIGSELRWQWLGDVLLYGAYAGLGALGLQLLSIGCLFLAFFFLSKIGGDKTGPWALLLMVAVCLGTYQLQMPRNSVFSLVLYPLLLWLGCRARGIPKMGEYLAVIALLLVWSFLHGSCVFGWMTSVLLFAPRALNGFAERSQKQQDREVPLPAVSRLNWRRGLYSVGIFAAAMVFSLVLISLGRLGAYHLLEQPLLHISRPVLEFVTGETPSSVNLSPVYSAETLRSLKMWFNNSIWKRDPASPWSNDYWSPFDLLPGNKPIECSYVLALMALLCMLLFRNVPIGLVLAWGASLFLGLGYVRMFGYLALSSAAVILIAFAGKPVVWKSLWRNLAGWIACAAWIGFFWPLMLSGRIDQFIPEGQHVSRVGQTPIYDNAVADWIKSEFPSEKVFTTIETGSYCLLRWNFEKQVFIDGFFAPHTRETWRAYHGARNSGDPSPLFERFGMTLAIIPTTSKTLVDRFRLSDEWGPIAIGNGAAVFAHTSLRRAFEKPKIFCRPEMLEASSHYYRSATLRSLFLFAALDSEGNACFASTDWTSLPEFGPLQEMAVKVFPVIESSDEGEIGQ